MFGAGVNRGLGLVASKKRKINPTKRWDPYFPPMTSLKHEDKILVKNGSVFTTLRLMRKIVRETRGDTKRLAPMLKRKTLKATIDHIWQFVYNHVQYKLDKQGVEQLHRPLRIWKKRFEGVDCDDYAIFISSILSNLGIRHAFRMTKYNGKNHYQHVYIVVPKNQSFK